MQPRELKVGDVVQIDPAHDDVFGGCFMQVTEPKGFGCQGFVICLKSGDKPRGDAYYRCSWEHMEYVGPATWVSP